jgi:uncharacterized protein YbjQ (UPF0145 family)
MLTATTESVPGKQITETLGLVRGSCVRSKHIGADIMAGLRSIVGGEMTEYSALLAGTREQALDRMIAEAAQMGADAVVAVRMETSSIMEGASEVVFLGTAVKLR